MHPRPDPSLFAVKGSDLPLSRAGLADLMQAVLGKGRPFRFKAKGMSMSPFIRDGDVVTVFPQGEGEIRPGDVVAFLFSGGSGIAVHRVVEKKQDCCVIRGDNIPEIDGLVPEERILGVVRRVERNGKRIDLGLGPERRTIAFLSRKGWLWKLLEKLRGARKGRTVGSSQSGSPDSDRS